MMSKLIFGLLFLACVTSASAAPAKTPPPTRGAVTKVDQSTGTVTAELTVGGNPVTFTFDDQSTIEINGANATVKQIKTGLFVRSIRLDSSTPPVVQDLDLVSSGN